MPNENNKKTKGTCEETSEEVTCGICFTSIHPNDNPQGKLNSCNHVFCVYCIKEWAQSTNVCPHCKARFTRIFSVDSLGNEEVTKVRKRNYRLWEEDYEDDDVDENNNNNSSSVLSSSNLIVCNICGQSDNAFRMILCDRRQCEYMVHLDCIQMTERPAEYFCPECTLLRTPISSTLISSETIQEKENEEEKKKETNEITPPIPPPPPQISSKKMPMPPPSWLKQVVQHQNQNQQEEISSFSSSVLVSNNNTLLSLSSSSRNHNSNTIENTKIANTTMVNSEDNNEIIHHAANSALQQFLQRQEQRNHMTNLRQQRQMEVKNNSLNYINNISSRNITTNNFKRPRSNSNNSNISINLSESSELLLNPNTRRIEEERLARRLALEILPILRRNQSLQLNHLQLGGNSEITAVKLPTENDIALKEKELYTNAMNEGRRMAHERMEAKVANIRFRKERLINIQAQREAAALAKLAKIIASRRATPKKED